MTLDWTAQAVPGKSVFNLDLGTSFANVVAHLKEYASTSVEALS